MKTSTLIILLIALSTSLFCQKNEIKGTVVDQKNDPIFFATVALYNAIDSNMISAESSDNKGKFHFKNIESGSYFLTTTMLGYADNTQSEISVSGGKSLEFDIQLSTDATLLSTVEIVDKAPLLEQKADKLIVNVADNITNTSGSLLDVMKKVPGMLVVRDRLSMVGSGTPTILLNGKTTQYMDVQSLLRDMPGDNIKKVEIIHQPGAEYEAAGSGPIINIILKKNSLFGTNGSVSFGAGKGQLWDYNTGLSLSHYAGNFNVSGGVGFSRNAWVETISLTRRLSDIGEGFDGNYVQTNDEAATPKTYRANVRMDWDVTSQHRLGLEAKIYDNQNKWIASNLTDVDLFQEQSEDYILNTTNDHDRTWQYTSINPYYVFEIDTNGQKLELDFNFARYKRTGFNTLTTANNLDSNLDIQRYDQPGDTKIYATTLDYTLPILKNLELKAGLKYSEANLDNNLISEFFDPQLMWVNNVNQSNHFLFDETIKAVYSKLSWTKGEWSGTAGLRYEDSESIGNSLTLDSIQTRNISKLFPSFSISRKVVGPLKGTISYSRRIDRPRYSTLNPFVFYLDPFTSERGNPSLLPELTHSGKFTISYEGQPFFNIEYKQSENAIVEVTQQEQNNQEAFKTDINFDKQTNFSATLLFPLEFIPGLNGYGGIVQSRNSYNSQYIGDIFNRSRWNTTLFFQAEFRLPWDIDAELGGWYTGGQQEGIFNTEYMYGTSAGISKKFLDRKLKVSLGAEDFFNRFWHASVDYQQDMDLLVTWQAPTVSARLSYKFGNQHLKSKKRRSGSASEEIRRAQQGK